MNDDIRSTPDPVASSSLPESTASPTPAPAVSAEPSAAPEVEKLTPELEFERSLNPPSVSDSYLRSFAAIYDSVVPVTETWDYIIFSEYGMYSDVSMYLFAPDSSLNADGSVNGSYTRYRIYSDSSGDNRFREYRYQSSSLVFPYTGQIRSANVYSNVLGYRPNPYVAEFHHAKAAAVSSAMTLYLLAFACLFSLIMGVLTKCLKKI